MNARHCRIIWWASGVENRLKSIPAELAKDVQIRDERLTALGKRLEAYEKVMDIAVGEIKASILRIENKIDRLSERKNNENADDSRR